MRGNSVTVEEALKIRQMYTDGKYMDEIMDETGRNTDSIYRALRGDAFGLPEIERRPILKARLNPPPRRRKKKLTVSQINEKVRAAGMSYGKWVTMYDQPRENRMAATL
jgi:hypothetical protein